MKDDFKSAFDVFGTTMKMIAAIFFFGFVIFIPGTYLLLWAAKLIKPVINDGIRFLLSVPLMVFWWLLICFIGIKYWKICKRWIITGHFHPEYNEEYFSYIREKWLKNNKGPRTAPKEWNVNLTKEIRNRTLSKTYPVFNGATNLQADPINYQTEIDISIMFHGNTPIKGDRIKVKFTAKSNINMKALHISIADTTPLKLRKSGEYYRGGRKLKKSIWLSRNFFIDTAFNYDAGINEDTEENNVQKKNIDSNFTEASDFSYPLHDKTICASNIKKDVPFTVEKEILVSDDVNSSCAIILWNELNETEMEAYLY